MVTAVISLHYNKQLTMCDLVYFTWRWTQLTTEMGTELVPIKRDPTRCREWLGAVVWELMLWVKSQGHYFSPPSQGHYFAPPRQGHYFSPPRQGHYLPLRDRGTTSPLQDRGITSPLRDRGTTSPLQDRGITSPFRDRGTTFLRYRGTTSDKLSL